MQQDKLPGDCTSRANCQASISTHSDGVSRKRPASPYSMLNLRYVKRRFSPLKLEDIMEVDPPQPTHYVRLVFDPLTSWQVVRGHSLDVIQQWLTPFGAKPVSEYHITLALLCCQPTEQFHDLSPLTHLLAGVKFVLSDFNVLGRTLVLNAHELQDGSNFVPVNMAVSHIKEWLKVHGYIIHNSHLPLHLSVSKLHDLDDNTRSYIDSWPYFTQDNTSIVVTPSALELVTIRGNSNNPKQIVQSLPIPARW
ncbi:hypothetical protein [Hypsugo bat coronavirus HKU25]|nr:hypothetical protein [Hypsugo bat coronavirus HKU25]